MIKLYGTLAVALLFIYCGQHIEKIDSDTVKDANQSTTLSTDTSKLSRLIDIATFKPTHAEFKYVFLDNSGQGKRLTVPGRSDSYLQAVLYFDGVTFNQLKTKYLSKDYPSPKYDRQEFNFDWLDPDVREELLQSDTSYYGHPDYSFGLGVNGKLWLLEDTVLLKKATD